MDPACGGGTFLVRAYARKRELDPSRKHGQLLSDLYGVDLSRFATQLTTINLATRDLIDTENYPQIARSDFFDIELNRPFLALPFHPKKGGAAKAQHRELIIPSLDAVVSNPPYVRQEDITRATKKAKNGAPEHNTKDYYQLLVRQESAVKLSGRSDLHSYFWPHATSFLKEDGYLCFLTSSQWLDVEYGFRLQEWILDNFEIIAILESIDEPWFVGARVVTAVTILRRQQDQAARAKNIVRFVQLRRPMRELLAQDGTTGGAVSAADQFRDELISLKNNCVSERYRARLVRQGDLWEQGVRLGMAMHESEDAEAEDADIEYGKYHGGKWGVYLRAPDLWFKLLDEYGTKLAPLGTIAEIRFGVKSGMDDFFFPIDCSSECLIAYEDGQKFERTYRVSRKQVESGVIKLVRCGEDRSETGPSSPSTSNPRFTA